MRMVNSMAVKHASDVRLVVFACEAGMGSSLIGANQLKKKLSALGRDIKVIHSPVNQIPADADIVVAHESLAERAREAVSVEVLPASSVRVGVAAPDYDAAIDIVGGMLVESGCVTSEYVTEMR